MAVIESKGDGYSLYNGVKLPSIDAVWDKEKYPYAFITEPYGEGYLAAVFFFNNPPVVVGYNVRATSETGVDSHHDNYDIKGDGTFELYAKDEPLRGAGISIKGISIIWTSHDIPNYDGSTHLSASDPVPLDGMNVIEWDGDTTGLAKLGTSPLYRVSSTVDVDVSKGVYSIEGSTGYPEIFSDMGDYWETNRSCYVPDASDTYPNVGIYLLRSDASYVSLFAYYPIEEAPEEEQPEISRGTLFLLYKMFSPTVFHALTGKTHWLE